MSQSEARAWWADVEHLRETIERRRAAHDAGDPADELAARRRSAPRPVADHAAGLEPEPVEPVVEPVTTAPAPDPSDELAAHRRARAAARREAFDRDVARRPHPGPTPADRRAAMAALAPGAASGRRTVTITGRTALPPSPREVLTPERLAPRRQPSRMPPVRVGPRPDRIAMWAVVLGFMLILAAATSSHAATGPTTEAPAHTAGTTTLRLR